MEKFLKYFPFIPQAKDTKKLLLAALFYIGISWTCGILATVLCCTILFTLVGIALLVATGIYVNIGMILIVMNYLGYDVKKLCNEGEEA